MMASRTNDRIYKTLHRSTFWIGMATLALLVILAAVGLFIFGQTLFRSIDIATPIEPETVFKLLDIVLFVFIIIELLNVATAFIKERRVIYTVFEAMLVAIARKVIVSGTMPVDLDKAASLALITVAVGITWWLVAHANLTPLAEVEPLEEPAPPPLRESPQQE